MAIGVVAATSTVTTAIGETVPQVDVVTGGTLAGLVALVFWIEWKLRDASRQARADLLADFQKRESSLIAHIKQMEELLQAAHERAKRYESDTFARPVPPVVPTSGSQSSSGASGGGA